MKSAVVTLLVLIMLPSVAGATADLHLSLGGSITYDPNVFRTKNNEQSDVLFRVTPSFRLSDAYERLKYEVAMGLPLERGISTQTDIDFDYTPRAEVTYQLSDRTKLSLNDRFRYANLRGNERLESTDEDTGELLQINDSRDDTVLQNQITGAVSHRITPRISGVWTLGHSLYSTTDPARSDNQSFRTNGSLRYTFSSKHTFTLGLGASQQNFDERPTFPGSQTNFFSLNAGWNWRITETLGFGISLAPNYVITEQEQPIPERTVMPFPVSAATPGIYVRDGELVTAPEGSLFYQQASTCQDGSDPTNGVLGTCATGLLANDPVNFPDEAAAIVTINDANMGFIKSSFVEAPTADKSNTLTLFGNVSLRQRWTPLHQSAINYSRRESNASGLGGSTALDSVSLTHGWTINDVWSMNLRGDWTKRKSLFSQNRSLQLVVLSDDLVPALDVAEIFEGAGGLISVEQDNSVDTERWAVSATVSRKVGRRWVARLNGRYSLQSSSQGSTGSTSDFANWLLRMTFTYSFEPIRLWR